MLSHVVLVVQIVLVLQGVLQVTCRSCLRKDGAWADAPVVQLDPSITFNLQYIAQDNTISIVLSSTSAGYLAIGLPEVTSGGMPGSDIVTVRMQNSKGLVEDRYAPFVAFPFYPYDSMFTKNNTSPEVWTGDYLFPYPDCDNGGQQDWALSLAVQDSVNGEMCSQYTISRKLETTDSNDRDFVPGPMRVLWAHSPTQGNSITYHEGNRGSAKVTFIDDGKGDPVVADECYQPACERLTFTMNNYTIPQQETTYARLDHMLVLPNAGTTSKHIIYFEHFVPEETKPYVHHIVLYGCLGNSTDTWNKLNTEDVRTSSKTCGEILYAWAVGGGPLKLPLQAGYPVGNVNNHQFLFVTLETHYTNPKEIPNLFDNSGITMHLTTELREHDAGTFLVGQVGSSIIPFGRDAYHLQSSCTEGCTEWWPWPLTVFASFLHMHSFGSQIWTSLYDSSGAFKQTTNRIDFWSFENQQTVGVNYTIQPGDHIQLHCIFNTSKWFEPIYFGESSFEEMCLDIVSYYPAVRNSKNSSLGMCGVQAFYPSPKMANTQCVGPNGHLTIQDDQVVHADTVQGANPSISFAAPGNNDGCGNEENGETAQVRPSSDSRFTFEMDVSSDVLFHWKVVDNGYIRARLETSGAKWLGVGLAGSGSNSMVNGVAVIATSAGVAEYELSSTRKSGVNALSSPSGGLLDSSFETIGKSVFEFNITAIAGRKLNLGPGSSTRRLLSSGENEDNVIFAIGEGLTFPEQHETHRVFTLDWVKGEIRNTDQEAHILKVRLIHGGLMTFAFGLLIPLGAAFGMIKVKRGSDAASVTDALAPQSGGDGGEKFKPQDSDCKSSESLYFKLHVLCMIISFFAQAGGATIILLNKSTHFNNIHEIVGVSVLGLVVVQLALGVFRPAYKPLWWVMTHRRILPVLIYGGALAAIALGMIRKAELDGSDMGLNLVYFLPTTALGLLIMIFGLISSKLM